MRSVKSRDTGPEVTVRKAARSLGYRFQTYIDKLPGRPDLVFSARRKVVFVHGCYWHGHHCPRGARIPKTNRSYWKAKIASNVARDKRQKSQLKRNGWRVLVVWECKVKNTDRLHGVLRRFLGPARRAFLRR
jgi:DNA mismatch endonuclease (patch repair protein)